MKCPNCKAKLHSTKKNDVVFEECKGCGGIWIVRESFEAIKDKRDPFISWLDIPLWDKDEHHKLALSSKSCPCCDKNLYIVEYKDSQVKVDVCMDCKAVWLDKGELEKLMAYMEDLVTEETIDDFIKDLGHEAVNFLKAKKDLKTEMRDTSVIAKLLEYRVFSKFPVLSQLASRIPLI